MGAVKNSGVFKGVSVGGQVVKGLAKNGVVFWKQETYHALTVRILARATAIGAVPDTDLNKFDTFIRSIADTLTTYFDVYYRFRGTGDANFKRINLANPEGVLADFYGGYTLDNSGFKGNGVNAYVDTNFNPSLLISGQKYQLNDASRYAVVSENTGTGTQKLICGSLTSTNFWYANDNQNAIRINQGTSNISSAVSLNGLGIRIVNRTTSNNVNIIVGTVQNERTSTSSSLANATQKILTNNLTTFSLLKVSSYGMGKSIPLEISQLLRTAENADMANLGLTQLA